MTDNGLTICPLESGSKGNAHLITNGNTNILLDCGISARILSERLESLGYSAEDIDAVFVTHEHSDHTKGVGVAARKFSLPVYATVGTWHAMYKNIKPLEKYLIKKVTAGEVITVGDISVTAFSISHDAAEPVGYSFVSGGKKISVATDTGVADEALVNALAGSEIAFIEANHDENMLVMGKYTQSLKRRIKSDLGHLSNDAAGGLSLKLAKSGTKTILIGHLSEENNYPELAYLTVKNIIEEGGWSTDKDVKLSVVTREFKRVTFTA